MSANIRDTYAVFPKWSQPFWTFVTGKPAADEKQPFAVSCWTYLVVSLLFFWGGLAASYALLTRGGGALLALLALSVCSTLYGSRLLILTIAHQCAHLRFCRGKRLNRYVHDALSTVICSQNFEAYRYDHFQVHHGLHTFGTLQDPVLVFIRQLGFREDCSRAQLWRRLLLVCVSPTFHGRYLYNRFRSNLFAERPARRALSLLWWGAMVAAVLLQPALRLPIALGYVLPVLFLYNVSSFLELICEHVWMRPIDSPTARQRITELIWGRFCGDAVPSGEGIVAWLRWGLRLAFYHLPCRLLVLTGDAPQHDFHHIVPNGWNWTMSAYERQQTVTVQKMEDREVWGLFAAIDIVFRNLSTVQEHQADLRYLEVEA
jgi:Fatty acid desaturase